MANPSKLTIIGREKSAAELRTMSSDAMVWLRNKIRELNNPSRIPAQINKETERHRSVTLRKPAKSTKSFMVGGMYFFYYNPKHKATLPYYDTFPLVIPLGPKPGADGGPGFLGLNLHYLPLKQRLVFLDWMLRGAILDKDGNVSRIRMPSAESLKKNKFFAPCIKHYLINHVTSKILAVDNNEWDVAAYLPIAQFHKAKSSEVWNDSLAMSKEKK